MSYLIFAMVLLDVFFGQLLPEGVSFGAYGVGLALIFLWFVGDRRGPRTHFDTLWLWWMVLGAYALVGFLLAAGFEFNAVPVMALTIFMMLFATATTTWIRPAVTVVMLFGSVHAAATIAFYLFPSLYESLIRGRFFTTSVNATGYMSALTSHYSYNAMYCVLALLAAVAWLMVKTSRRWRVFLVLIALVAFIALVLTTKRAHLLVVVLAIVVGMASSNIRGRFFKIVIGGIVAVFAVFIAAQFSPGIAASLDRVFGTFETTDLSEVTSGRTQLWDYALKGWEQNPLFGHGWTTYEYIWPGGTLTIHAHNVIINALYEGGLVGAALVLITTLGTALAALRIASKMRAEAERDERLGAMFAVLVQVFMVAYSYTSGELLRSDYTFIPYLLSVAMVLALRNQPTKLNAQTQASFAPPATSHERV